MNNEDRIEALEEALEHLAEAERLVRSAGSPMLKAYVADHIDYGSAMLGKGMCGLITDEIDEIKDGKEDEEV